MSLENSVKFIQACVNNDNLKAKMKHIDTSDKEAALKEIVSLGKSEGYDYTIQEYEEASKSLFKLYEIDKNGIEEIKPLRENAVLANCACTGCAACTACLACLACISCAWCIVIPFGGEAVIAADAAAVVSAATTAAVGVSTAVATAAQGN